MGANLFRCGIILSVALVAGGCIETDIPPAGSYSDVLLVTEQGSRDPLATLIFPHLARELDFYVSKDIQFNVKFARAADLDAVPYNKNIVFCGVASPISHVGRRITAMLGETGMSSVQSGGHIFKKNDLPGPGQLTLIITAESEEDLVATLAEKGQDIRDALEESCRERIRRYLLKNRNEALISRFRQEYGFSLQVPTLYRLFSEESHPPGVELMRDGPPRSLGVFWLDWETPLGLNDRQEMFDIRANYVRERYNGDAMDSTRVEFSEGMLGDYPAIKMEGYWSNENSVAGGYFVSYFIHKQSDDLLWVVDMLVYAPGLPKHPHFRELLSVAETFRLR
jgi:hypothetical protein